MSTTQRCIAQAFCAAEEFQRPDKRQPCLKVRASTKGEDYDLLSNEPEDCRLIRKKPETVIC
jgi:hypothetical protein